VQLELAILLAARDQAIPSLPALLDLEDDLWRVNGEIWNLKDQLRDHERRGEFGPRFVELARSVFRHNDRRAELKRIINDP
jgi:hypothetical protein